MAVLGAGFTAWGWYTALTRGYFYRAAGILFPAFFVLGVALLIFPEGKDERVARTEEISTLPGWKRLAPRWRTIVIVALVAAVVNYVLLSSL